jgi:hypothetical protein
MAKDDNKKIVEVAGVPVERHGTRPDFSIPPPRKQLPKELQDTLNDDEKMWEVLYDGEYVLVPQSSSTYPFERLSAMRRLSSRSIDSADKTTERKIQQTQTSAMPRTPREFAPLCFPRTAM